MAEEVSRRERKKQETQLRLMEAALALFLEHGFDATTVEQIAKAADVAKGTFFNYFETKEAILPALIKWRLQQAEKALRPGQDTAASPIDRIKMALCLLADDPLLDMRLAKQLFVATMRHHGEPPHIHPGRTLAELLTQQVRQAQATGEIRADLDPVYLGCVIRALFFQQLIMSHQGNCPTPLKEALANAIDLLLDGAAGPTWRK